jgi:hypothetical protein
MAIFWKKKLLVKCTFGQMTFRSNDHFQKTLSVKLIFGQTTLCAFFSGQMTFFAESRFSLMTIFCKKKSFIWPFGKMNFRSNGIRLNGDSVEWTFGQMAFGQTVFGQMLSRSNGLSVKNFRWNDFTVKWSRTLTQYISRWNMRKWTLLSLPNKFVSPKGCKIMPLLFIRKFSGTEI